MSGVKHFRKREALYDYLKITTAHPSAETIYTDLKQQIPDLAIGTVYRNLTLFKQQGLISSVATVGGVERFDANTDPHVHFICQHCHAVMDLMEMQVPDDLRQAASALCGGRVESCQLSFSGVCRDCVEKEKKGSESA